MEGNFVTDLGVVLGVAAATSVIARTLRQPTIVGYLLAGLIVGPYIALPLFADPHRVHALAEFGVVLVMFAVGLEFRIARFLRSLPVTGLTGLVQVGTMIYLGFTLGTLFGWTTVTSLFLGTSVAISSTMVVSRVFTDQPPQADIRDHVLSVLVLQDVIAIMLIAAMTGVAQGGELAPAELALVLLRLTAILVGMVIGGLLVVPRVLGYIARFESAEILTVVSVGICFAFAVLAQQLGYSIALGAFIAGIVVAESGRGPEVEHTVAPLRDVFAAVFFVSIGMTVDPVAAWEVLPLSLIVAAVVIIGQFLSVSVAGVLSGIGLRRAATSGLALGQIGEFGFIIAAIGLGTGVAGPELQAVLVTVAVITTFTTPLLLKRSGGVVEVIDRALPRRFRHLLSLYEGWLERARTQAAGRSRVGRYVLILAVDAIVLITMLAFTLAWLPELSELLSGRLGLSLTAAQLIIGGSVLLISVPLLRGIVRTALALSQAFSDAMLSSVVDDDSAAGVRVAGHTLRAMIYLGIVIGVGLPAVAVLQPLMAGSYGIFLLAGIVLVLSIVLWRRAGAMDDVYRSGAAELADRLARRAGVAIDGSGAAPTAARGRLGLATQAAPSPPAAPEAARRVRRPSTLLPGLDAVAEVTVPRGADAAGRTLRDLHLRTLTGASIVAIDRAGIGTVLPTGSERLDPGDVCAVTGSADSVARAREMLTRDPDARIHDTKELPAVRPSTDEEPPPSPPDA